MMSRTKQITLVGKLLKLTFGGDVNWEFVDAPDAIAENDEVRSETYELKTDEIVFTIYVVRKRRWKNSSFKRLANTGFSVRGETFWETRTVLELRDPKTDLPMEIITDVEYLPILKNLFDAARRSVSDVDDKIDAFLEKEPTHAQ